MFSRNDICFYWNNSLLAPRINHESQVSICLYSRAKMKKLQSHRQKIQKRNFFSWKHWSGKCLIYVVVSVVRITSNSLFFSNLLTLNFSFSFCYFEHVDIGLDIIAFWLVKMGRRYIKKKSLLRNINHPQLNKWAVIYYL